MQARSLLLLCFIVLASTFPYTFAQGSVAPAADAATVVRYAHAAEDNPLDPLAPSERREAKKFAENDHTSHVILCFRLFQAFLNNHASNAEEIRTQYLISASAFLYEHPEAASSHIHVNAAGAAAALHIYETFLEFDPKTRSTILDSLEKQRSGGAFFEHPGRYCQ